MKVVEAVFFGFAREVSQVGFKIFDEGGESTESGIGILAATDSEKIIGGFPGSFGHGTISDCLSPFSSVLE